MRQFARFALATVAVWGSFAHAQTPSSDFIVRLKVNASLAKFRVRLVKMGVSRIEGLLPELRIVRLRKVSLLAARKISSDASVAWSEFDAPIELVRPTLVEPVKSSSNVIKVKGESQARLPADALMFAQAEALKRIGAPVAWEVSTGSASVRVAILSSGLATDHADLSGNVALAPELRTDSTGAGTFAAGVIGAAGDNGIGLAGLAWRVTLDPVGILTPSGKGSVSSVLVGMRHAVKRGASIALLGFQTSRYSRALREAAEWMIERGSLLVAASGDRFGSDNDTVPVYPASYVMPGLVSVAAIDEFGEALSDATNYGNREVEIAAPGEAVLTTERGGGYVKASGSLLAASHVAGAAALMLSRDSGLAPVRIHERILRAAKPLSTLSGKVRSGATLDLAHLLAPSEN